MPEDSDKIVMVHKGKLAELQHNLREQMFEAANREPGLDSAWLLLGVITGVLDGTLSELISPKDLGS